MEGARERVCRRGCRAAAARHAGWHATGAPPKIPPGAVPLAVLRGGACARSARRATVLAGLLLSACAEMPAGLPLLGGVATEQPAESGSCPTPEACTAELKKLVANPRRDWIGRPQSAEAYADGTRMFAYRALRRRLSCSELVSALEDTSAAAQLLQSPQHEQARTLTSAVARELKAEHVRRCRPRG